MASAPRMETAIETPLNTSKRWGPRRLREHGAGNASSRSMPIRTVASCSSGSARWYAEDIGTTRYAMATLRARAASRPPVTRRSGGDQAVNCPPLPPHCLSACT